MFAGFCFQLKSARQVPAERLDNHVRACAPRRGHEGFTNLLLSVQILRVLRYLHGSG